MSSVQNEVLKSKNRVAWPVRTSRASNVKGWPKLNTGHGKHFSLRRNALIHVKNDALQPLD